MARFLKRRQASFTDSTQLSDRWGEGKLRSKQSITPRARAMGRRGVGGQGKGWGLRRQAGDDLARYAVFGASKINKSSSISPCIIVQ